MKLTREQLRAARALLNLRQDQLAKLADVGVATLRRYEGGKEVGPSLLGALRAALEGAGAIILDAEEGPGRPPRGVGVALRTEGATPQAPTRDALGGEP